jgi:AcrR family transcriptional regulator
MAVKRDSASHPRRRSDPDATRPAQRRRTRKAIVDAAMRLVARGETPSVADVAAAAEVSRRTVYLYFPTFDQLLLDATVGVLTRESVDRAIDRAPAGEAVEERVERMVRTLHQMPPQVERLGRELIRLTVAAGGDTDDRTGPRRGYRRIEWIEAALAPLRGSVDAPRWQRLVAALAMVVGWEALIVQRDVCGLSASEGEEVSVWAARALLQATLQNRRRSPPRSKARPR